VKLLREGIELVIHYAFQIYTFLVFGYVLLSWIPQLRGTPIGDLLTRLVEPYIRLFKTWIPPIGMIDITPIVALFMLYFSEEGLLYVIDLLYQGI
jgi:YggT family protein